MLSQKSNSYHLSVLDFPGVHAERKRLTAEFGMHWHSHYEIEYIISGTGYGVINEETYHLEPGTFYFLTPSDFHKIVPEDTLEIIWITFDGNLLRPELIDQIYRKNGTFFLKPDKSRGIRYYNFFNMMAEECKADRPYATLVLENLLETVLILILRETEASENTLQYGTYVTHAVAYLESNFKESPSLTAVAAHLGLNKNYFCSLFRKETGKTFVQYVRDLKLNYGNRLLKNTDYSVQEICARCGFGSLSAFIREYKKKYGETPLKGRMKKEREGKHD